MARDFQEYERSVIGSVLVTPARMAECVSAGITAEWFESDEWSLMWSALAEFWRRGEIESVTPISAKAEAERLSRQPRERRVAEKLTDEALMEAVDASAPGMLEGTITLLRNCWIERRFKQALNAEPAMRNFYNYADGLVEIRGRIDNILSGVVDSKKISARAVLDDLMAEYREAHQMRVAADGPRDLKWTPGIKLPWPKMTEFMNGLRAGLHVVAARPSVGKTAFAVNLMHFWLDIGINVLFCSLDMPRLEVFRRILAEKARVSARKATFSPTYDDLTNMENQAAVIASMPLTVVETHDVDDLRTMCMVEKSAGRLDVLVVDYLQLLRARALGREDAVEYARVSYVSDTLKRIANDLHIPVVALAQLNREVAKQDAAGRAPGLSDLRGSGSIEQDAFTVTVLHRDTAVADKWRGGDFERVRRLIPGAVANPAYRYNSDDIDPIWWILVKAQNGPTGKLPFVVRKKYFAWMLGDWEAEAETKTVGYGSTQRVVADNSPKFERVHSDWRHDPIEQAIEAQFALIRDTDDVRNFDD